MFEVFWRGGLAFEAVTEDGFKFMMDVSKEHGGQGLGPSPFDALLGAAATCSAIDVVEILHKKRLVIDSYRIEVGYERGPQGILPRPITAMVIHHFLTGPNLDEISVKQAVELSDQKYCTVVATLRNEVGVKSEFTISSTSPQAV